jgi:hypothetical protein
LLFERYIIIILLRESAANGIAMGIIKASARFCSDLPRELKEKEKPLQDQAIDSVTRYGSKPLQPNYRVAWLKYSGKRRIIFLIKNS